MPVLRLAVSALVAFTSAAQAFPQDGQFYRGFTCPADGFVPGGENSASLAFPQLCLFEQCCTLSNPVNIRDMEQVFLYDGACSAEGTEFSARLLVGDSSGDGLIVVLENAAHTYTRCEP